LVENELRNIENNSGVISKGSSKVISSVSKALSFYSPKKYFILDTRVAFVMNSIIMLNKLNNPLIPLSFSKSQSKILRVNYKNICEQYGYSSLDKHENMIEAYTQYCINILDIHKSSKYSNSEPEIIEMIFFKAAEQIKSSNYNSFKIK
jgi:hypothetical protein